MPSHALRRDFDRLVGWAARADCPISDLSLGDDDKLRLTLRYLEDDSERSCNIVAQLSASGYPRAAARLCEESAKESTMHETLELVNFSIADGCTLAVLVETLGATIGVEVEGLEEALAAQAGDDEGAGPSGTREVDDADFEMEEANEFAMNQGEATDSALHALQRRWQQRCAKEDAEAEVEGGALSKMQIPPALREMFSSAESSKILITELLQLVRDNMIGISDFRVDAVDDSVHTWRVRIADVDPSSALGAQMREAGSLCLELELEFTRGLHPTYPPWLRLRSPRLKGAVGQAVMACSLFSPTGWDPLKPIKAVVRSAQALLEEHAELAYPDGGVPDAWGGGHGGYSHLEHVCCRLEALASAQLRPRWAHTASGEALHRVVNAVTEHERLRLRGLRTSTGGSGGKAAGKAAAPEPVPKVVWAAGTGYGHGKGRTQTWDAKASAAAQQQLDGEVR
jgi:hypothetical protein